MGYIRKLFGSGVSIVADDDHVRVERPSGYIATLQQQLRMLTDIEEVCEDAGCYKVLIHGPQTRFELSTLDLLDLGTAIARSKLRMAFVENHNATDVDIEFLEDIVWNRGGRVQFFQDEVEAMDWLRVTQAAAIG